MLLSARNLTLKQWPYAKLIMVYGSNEINTCIIRSNPMRAHIFLRTKFIYLHLDLTFVFIVNVSALLIVINNAGNGNCDYANSVIVVIN